MRLRQLWLPALVVVGCREASDQQVREPVVHDIGVVRPAQTSSMPVTFCNDLQPEIIEAVSTVILAAPGESADVDVVVDKVAALDDSSVYLLDRRRPQVVHLDLEGRVLHRWGRRGAGPGELSAPSAISAGNRDAVIVVDRGRLLIYSRTGAYIRTVTPGIPRVSDAALLPNGMIVVARDVFGIREPGSVPFAAVVDSTGAVVRELLIAPKGQPGQRPFVLHLSNPVRVSAGEDGTFAIWFPFDPTVYVFTDAAGPPQLVRGCVPDERLRFYRAQWAQGEMRAASVRHVLGIHVGNEGVIMAVANRVGGMPAGRLIGFGVARGRPEMVYDFRIPERRSAFTEAVFIDRDRFIGFGIQFGGDLRLWTVEGREDTPTGQALLE